MSYTALYRKFRPSVFDDVRGQDHVVRTLRNQVKTERLQHAYLFCGTRGTGKTSIAKILAKAVNCENPENGNPCGVCETCRGIAEGTSMNVIEIDAASNNGVDNIRDIIEEVQYRPTHGKYKVYIIDEVHMLSAGAFNALLKTLEEPPSYVIFILATTDVGRIPVTILSRCQRYDFRRIDAATIAGRLRELTDREGIAAEERALAFLARAADGSMRDALSLLDRCAAFYMDEELTYDRVLQCLGEADTKVFTELTNAVISGNSAEAMRLFGSRIAEGSETGQLISDFIRYLRNLLIVSTASPEEAQELIDVSSEQLKELVATAEGRDPEVIMRCIRILSELQNRMRFATNRRVLAELAVLQLTRPEGEHSEEALAARVVQLEEKVRDLQERGVEVQTVIREAPDTREDTEREKVVLPDAAPEDLKAICAEWPRLIGSMPDGMGKNIFLHNTKLQYNTETLENVLHLEITGGAQAAKVVIDRPEYLEDLVDHLERKTGRRITVEIHQKENTRPEYADVDVDRMYRNKISMDIESEEE